MMNRLQNIILIIFLSSCTLAQTKGNISSLVGLVSLQEDSTICLLIANPNLVCGTKFIIVSPNVQGSSIRAELKQGVVIKNSNVIHDLAASMESGDNLYFVRVFQGTLIKHNPYFAVFVPPQTLTLRDSEIVGDINGDGILEYFRQCTSHEGLHLTIWSGAPLKGTCCWHRYYYLGYDVEPTCSESEYEKK